MKEIKEMIESAFNAKDARSMLNMWYSFGKISSAQLEKGRKIIQKNFSKDQDPIQKGLIFNIIN